MLHGKCGMIIGYSEGAVVSKSKENDRHGCKWNNMFSIIVG